MTNPYPLAEVDWRSLWSSLDDGIENLGQISETQRLRHSPERLYGAILDLAEVTKVLCVIEWAGLMADPQEQQ